MGRHLFLVLCVGPPSSFSWKCYRFHLQLFAPGATMSQVSSSPRLALPATVEIPCPSTRQSASNNTSMPKLRDSCVACASSKVRCHRQKPSCSRCLKRKITCEYVTSKRGGRNPAGRSETTKVTKANNAKASSSTKTARQSSRPSSPPIDWFVPSFCGTDVVQIPHHATTTSTSSTTLTDPLLGVGASTSMEMDSLDSDFDRFLASSSSYYTPLEQEKSMNSLDICMLGDLGHLGDLDALSMVIDGDYTLPPTDPSLKSDGSMTPAVLSSISLTSVSPASSQLLPPALIDNILHDTHDCQSNDFQCGCLLYSVGLMKQFFDDQPGLGSDFVLDKNRTTTSSQVQVTIARNKRVIDTIHSILRCCFAHDSYLLLILSMILLKVLDSYADAAHINRRSPVPGSTHGSGSASPTGRNSRICSNKLGSLEDVRQARDRSISSNQSIPTGCSDESRRSSIESAYSARTSMHWILGELHRPQRLVNQLSELLKKEAARNSGSEANIWNCSSPSRPNLTPGSRDTSLFSDIIWRQLGQDLRRRLQKLSLDIIEALKRE